MVRHNLNTQFFHGCNDCRDCCNGKLFSMGEINYSDFKTIVKLFPTAINISDYKMVFFYSLVPLIGCHYLRDNQCSIYGIIDRPNTCLNYPFGIDNKHTIQSDNNCPNLNTIKNDYPVTIGNEINPKVMNDFFSEKQYIDNINNLDTQITNFVKVIIDNGYYKDLPQFKTSDDQIVDLNSIEFNKDLKIIDLAKIPKLILSEYNQFIQLHILSLENLPRFGQRLLEQI